MQFGRGRRKGITRSIRNWSDEAISPARDGFNKNGVLSRVPEGITKLLKSSIDPFVEINERAIGPQLFANVLAGNDFPRVLEQHGENTKWFFLQGHTAAVAVELAGCEVR